MDTTVILAQPRGSQLRADVVYVDSPGSAGRQPGEIFPHIGANRTDNLDPPDPGFISVNFVQTNPLEMRWVDPPGAQPFYDIFFFLLYSEGYNPPWV